MPEVARVLSSKHGKATGDDKTKKGVDGQAWSMLYSMDRGRRKETKRMQPKIYLGGDDPLGASMLITFESVQSGHGVKRRMNYKSGSLFY